MTKKLKYSAYFFVGFAVIVILYSIIAVNGIINKNKITPVVNESAQVQNTRLLIDYSDGFISSYEFDQSTEGKTVYELLTKASQDQNIPIETKQYDFGVFVESINGYRSGTSKSWIYFVNGESGQVAADQMKVKNGDLIEWKYLTPTGE